MSQQGRGVRLRVGVGYGLRGHYAMLYDADTGEPWQTGDCSFADAAGAYAEAAAWGEAEGLPFDTPAPVASSTPARRAYAGIGSRETPPEILTLMRSVAARLAAAGWRLRSGAAPGADAAFESGAGSNCEIYLPWRGFQDSRSELAIERMPVLAQAEEIAAAHHPAWQRLGRPVRLLMARNACQVLGADLRSPVAFVLCWAPNPRLDEQGRVCDVAGGTGLAVRLAYARNIPIFHLGLPAHRQRIDAFLAA